ncbi:TRAP transporter small permease [Loktanella sp. S4079]|uniref:TRAP transporter small permease n=1 Tax=Loktanella sp. S4079 TaxID=579483 RepID=UPI0005FA7C83|nr:TRAP transporter small permease subunit [Loktanella sp. S4079]KJZ19047.1 C4-dicarboxylate ABC transporter substrate-binding protein [Loktanella sp. S4079]
MAKLNSIVSRIFGWGAGLSMGLVFAIIFVNSLRRYTIGESVQWGEELPVYLSVYGVMFGVALAYMQDRHIRFTIVIDFLNERRKTMMFVAGDILMAVTGVMLVLSALAFVERRGGTMSSGMFGLSRWLGDVTGIKALNALGTLGPYQYALVIGGAMITLAAVLKFIERVTALRGQ